jgi:hypothetical protein
MVIDHIKTAESKGFQCIIIGDFNADPYKYHKLLEQGRTPPPFYQLVQFLTDRNYIDQSPKDDNGKEFATFISQNQPTSRIDLLWYPDSMIRNVFCFDQVWTLPSSKYSSDSSVSLDHRCIIGFFTKHLLLGHLPVHRLKQKKEWRTVYNFKQCSTQHWDNFKTQVDEKLSFNMANVKYATLSTLPLSRTRLNTQWQVLKDSIKQAAKVTIKTRSVNPNFEDETPEKLILTRQHLSTLNKVFAFINRLLYPGAVNKSTCFSIFQHTWVGSSTKPGLVTQLKDIIFYFSFNIDTDGIPSVVSNNTLIKFKTLVATVAALRNIIRAQRQSLERSYSHELISRFENERCSNYAMNKAAFISSSLNRSKRSIILDRAMTGSDSDATLETDPIKVKHLAKEHFRTIAGIPPPQSPSLHNMPDNWQTDYLPLDDIDPTIYQDLLSPPSDEE